MTKLHVEIDGNISVMRFAKISEMMTPKEISALLDSMTESHTITVMLKDGTRAVVRQDVLLSPEASKTLKSYEVRLSTAIPVSACIFILADNEADATQKVQEMLAKGKIHKTDFVDLRKSLEAELQHWIEQTDQDDWRVEDITETP